MKILYHGTIPDFILTELSSTGQVWEGGRHSVTAFLLNKNTRSVLKEVHVATYQLGCVSVGDECGSRHLSCP